jgi:hypothetical protein
MVLWSLSAVAVQWYVVAIDSGMYSRISSAMLLTACLPATTGTVYRDDELARPAAETGRRPSLWRRLRLVPWGLCAVAYLSATAVVAGAYGQDVAFPALSVYWTAVVAVSFIAPLKRRIRRLSPTFSVLVTSVPAGLFIGGMSAQTHWVDDPWAWVGIALSGLVVLGAFRPRAGAWIRERRQRRAERRSALWRSQSRGASADLRRSRFLTIQMSRAAASTPGPMWTKSTPKRLGPPQSSS